MEYVEQHDIGRNQFGGGAYMFSVRTNYVTCSRKEFE